MLTNAQTYFVHSPWLVFLPGLCMLPQLAVGGWMAANLFRNAVRDAFDPRLR